MAHDVFISYSSKDKASADAVCAALENAGIRCWIAPRDIAPGGDWSASILEAIGRSRVLLLIFTGHANASRHIQREVQHACDQGLAVVPFRVENVEPTGGMKYYLGPVQWLDALTPPVQRHHGLLINAIKALLPAVAGSGGRVNPPPDARPVEPGASPGGRVASGKLGWLGCAFPVLMLIGYGLFKWHMAEYDKVTRELVEGNRLRLSDPAAAVGHYQFAAEHGSFAAQRNLGTIYENGWPGHPPEPEKAVTLFEQAAAQNDASAQDYLGTMYEKGWPGHPPEPEKAVKLYEQAAAQNHARAQDLLGYMYEKGWPGHPPEPEKAVKLYEQAAAQNDAGAQNDLGLMYYAGWPGHPPDLEKTLKYFRLAADQGYSSGQWNLARLYDLGKGVQEDRAKAIELYKKAAAQGHPESRKRLLALGESVP